MVALYWVHMSRFFSKYGYYIVAGFMGLLLLVSIPYMSDIANLFGIETRASLKQKLSNQTQDLNRVKDIAKSLDLTVKKELQSIEITSGIVDKKLEKDLSVVTDIHTVEKERRVAISKVSNNKTPKTKTPISSKYTSEEAQEIAAANIDAVWGAYKVVAKSS